MSGEAKCAHGTECIRILDQSTSLRAELAASENLVAALQAELAATAQRAVESVREAREEQREAIALAFLRSDWTAARDAADEVRATPLDATPLGDRLREIEDQWMRWKQGAMREAVEKRHEAKAERDALKARVERLTKAMHDACFAIREGQDYTPLMLLVNALKEKP